MYLLRMKRRYIERNWNVVGKESKVMELLNDGVKTEKTMGLQKKEGKVDLEMKKKIRGCGSWNGM